MAAPSFTHCRAAAVLAKAANWVASNGALAEAAERWGGAVGLDTEFQRTNTYFPIAGLYQLSAASGVWLIDPLAIDEWAPLRRLLEDAGRVKVMHSCSEDLELLGHHLGARPTNLFDTQLAYAFLSEHYSLSYANLVKVLLGLDLPKQQTRSDWLRRPLSAAQLGYACGDVASLLDLHGRLQDSLEALGRRRWFGEEMARRERPAQNEPEAYFTGVKGAWRLRPEALGALRALCAWRERKAAAADLPRNWVVRDEHLFDFARQPRLSQSAIESRMPQRLARRYGQELLSAHADGQAQPETRAVPRPLSGAQAAALKQLQDLGRSRAAALGMAPQLLSRRRDLVACLRHYAAEGELPETHRGWRWSVVGADFAAILAAANA